jgi:hypothetical protein
MAPMSKYLSQSNKSLRRGHAKRDKRETAIMKYLCEFPASAGASCRVVPSAIRGQQLRST